MRITLHLKEKAAKMWTTLRNDLEMDTSALGAYLIRQEFERRQGKQPAKTNRGPGRPADSALAKSAKQKVGWQIGVLQRMKDEGTKLPNFDRALVAMNALMEAGLWQKALDYQRSNWWRQFAPPDQAIEPDWQKWLEEAEGE